MLPLPKGRVWLEEPSERLVIAPEPNLLVVPVTVLPLLSRSVVRVPEPNGCVRDCVPSDQRVIVPEPNLLVWPVIVLPCLSRSVVMLPPPNAHVRLLEPSERLVMVPEPNSRVLPVRGLVIVRDGGSAASSCPTEKQTAQAARAMARGELFTMPPPSVDEPRSVASSRSTRSVEFIRRIGQREEFFGSAVRLGMPSAFAGGQRPRQFRRRAVRAG